MIEIDQGRPFGLEGILQSGIEAPFEAVRLLAEISEAVAARARLALERLGPLPKDQFTRHVTIRAGINKPFRNGLTANLELLLESEENNFRDKTLDPTFGGAGFPPRFPSSFTAGLIVPLGRGRGSVGVAAQERSARFSLAARQEQVRHVATEEVYRTLLAYVRLIAAQENVKLSQASSERQRTIVGLVDQRVRGGESARVDSFRAQARAATVEGALSGAQAELVDARMSLAEAMGLDAGTLAEAPAAADRFADVKVDMPTVSALIASAMESRRDRLALDQARRASAELARGARADTRRVYDLNFSGGFADAYESENFRYLADERNPIFSELNPPKEFDETHRFYSPKGYFRSLSGRWEPFVTGSISIRAAAWQQRRQGPAGPGAGDAALVRDPVRGSHAPDRRQHHRRGRRAAGGRGGRAARARGRRTQPGQPGRHVHPAARRRVDGHRHAVDGRRLDAGSDRARPGAAGLPEHPGAAPLRGGAARELFGPGRTGRIDPVHPDRLRDPVDAALVCRPGRGWPDAGAGGSTHVREPAIP